LVEFAPRSSHIATLPVTVAPSGLSCQVELWLSPDGETKAASSGLVPFTSTGSEQQITLPVDMPSEEGTYHVLVDLFCEGILVGAYQALEDVGVVSPIPSISIKDVFITSNYDPPTAADDYIHARITNNGSVEFTGDIIARRWESWMDSYDQASKHRQTITIKPGETIEYHEHIHGNDYTQHRCRWWLTGDWTTEPLTPMIPVQSGFHLGSDDPRAEAYALDVGKDYAVIRYAQFGTCNKWEHSTYTPPLRPWEQYLKGLWYTDPAYCGFWFIPNLLPGRLYESYCQGGTIANREDWVQFSTRT